MSYLITRCRLCDVLPVTSPYVVLSINVKSINHSDLDIGHALVTRCHLCDVIPEDGRVFAPLHTASLKERVRNEGAGLLYCQRYRRALHAGRTAPIGRHSSPALIGHQTLELLRSDWLNLEPPALDNPAVT